jgi:hypothetical protein
MTDHVPAMYSSSELADLILEKSLDRQEALNAHHAVLVRFVRVCVQPDV